MCVCLCVIEQCDWIFRPVTSVFQMTGQYKQPSCCVYAYVTVSVCVCVLRGALHMCGTVETSALFLLPWGDTVSQL